MKNKDLYTLEVALEKVKDLKGIKFSLCVVKNKKLIKNELEDLQKVKPVTPQQYIEYETKRIELCREYALLDDDGKPTIQNDNYIIDQSRIESFKKAVEKMSKPYKEIIEKYSKEAEDFNKILEEDVILNLYKIDEDELPSEITAEQLEIIYDYLINKEKEKDE